MADDIETAAGMFSKRSRKRKRTTPIPKLIPNQKVEVRSIEEGFEGSWHSATVINSKNQNRVVKYERIVCDDGSDNLVESVPISTNNFRGRIRLVPPQFKDNLKCLHYGQCVDVFHEDAWWEGVVFDHDDMADKRLVFFPDIGDELRARIKNIRLTRDWNADTDVWKFRGDWVFLQVLEELELEWPILVSVKQIWYELRTKKQFEKEIKEWTCKSKEIWKETVKEVILDNLKLTMVEFFGRLQCQGDQILDINKKFLDSIAKIKPSFFSSSAVLPFDSNHSPVEDKSDDNNDDGEDDDDDYDDADYNDAEEKCDDNDDDDGEETCDDNVDDDDDDDGEIEMGPPGFSKNEMVVCTHSDEQSYKWTQLRDFYDYVPDVVVEPEYSPGSISEYYNKTCQNSRPPHALTLKVRQHLLYLGWKIELKRDSFGRNQKESLRYRYTDPTGKLYFSLTVACTDICNSSSEHTSMESYEPPSPRSPPPRQKMDIEPEFCPQSVVDYYSLTSEENGYRRNQVEIREYRMLAKKHLLSVGWSMFYAGETHRAVYMSPNGRKFNSVRRACNYYLSKTRSHSPIKTSEVDGQKRIKEKEVGKLIIKKKNGVLSIEALTKRKESFLNSIDEETKDSSRKSRVLRSSKRAREDISPMHQTPRTVLSWLIDNSVIVPRSKVQYRCRKDGHTMKEGRVTRDGIKCSCCQIVFSVSKFEAHAGSSYRRPSANIYLEDGRSLVDCQLQLKSVQNARLRKTESHRLKGSRLKLIKDNDYICSVCHYGGELVLCDQCPASFHTRCLGLKEVPDGDWFCPSCCCRICNQNKFGDCEQDTDSNILNCEQCERRYHIGCLKKSEGFSKVESYPQVNWFCSTRCEEIYLGINELLGKAIPAGQDDLTFTILKHKSPKGIDHDPSNMEEITESYSKLNIAISVMHECFDPVKEPRTQRDIVEDVIFCRWSELSRLNFKGFYTVLLEKDDELVSAATIRIYGEKVAELPLIGTRFQYRRRGMCHALMNVLEKKLVELGVERLVLPAVPSVLHTWTSSFGFSVMTESQKLEFLGYTFLDFQGTHMCQKLLQPSANSSLSQENGYKTVSGSNAMDLDGISAVSEVPHAERVKSMIIDQHFLDSQGNTSITDDSSAPHEILQAKQPSSHDVECTMETSNAKEDGNNGLMKCYHRRKIVACES